MGQASPKSIIELNGQSYDAKTGLLISKAKPKATPARSMDIQRPHIPRGTKPSKAIHKTTEHSKTLMRRGVVKPGPVKATTQVAGKDLISSPEVAINQSFHQISRTRTKRAENTPRNSLIKRFADFSSHTKTSKTIDSVAPATIPVHEPVPAAFAASKAFLSKADKVIENGLRSAESHVKKPVKKTRLHQRIGHKFGLSAKAASITAGSVALLALAGFFGYQNVPNLNVRYAAAKAGVHGSLPGYQPSGYAVNDHIFYSPGIITISYKANADNRSYKVTQQNTSWNSQELKEHLASNSGMAPQIYPDNGRTIYLHDSGADWVAGGVWYSVSGNASLNTEQLIKIASSI